MPRPMPRLTDPLAQIPPSRFPEIFRELASFSKDLIVIADRDRTIVYVNQATCDATGYKSGELVGARIPVFHRKEYSSRYRSKVAKDLQSKGVWCGEMEVMRKDGTAFWTESTVMVFHDERGRQAGTIGIGRDLTNDRLLRVRSLEDDTTLRRLIDGMADAVCVCDPAGKIQMVNHEYCSMLGYSMEELLGAQPPYAWLDPEEQMKMQHAARRIRKEGVLRNVEMTWNCKDKGRLNVSVAMSRLQDDHQKTIGRICCIRDISNVRYSDELQQAHEQLRRLQIEVKRKAVHLGTLEEMNTLVLGNANRGQFFRAITNAVTRLVEHDLAGFYAFDESHRLLVAHNVSKQTAFSRKLAKFPLAPGQGIIGEAAVSGNLVLVNNAQLDPRSTYPPGMRPEKEHFVAVPLKGRDEVYGILVVSRNRDPEFIEEEVMLMKSMADAATVALETVHFAKRGGKEAGNDAVLNGDRPPRVKSNGAGAGGTRSKGAGSGGSGQNGGAVDVKRLQTS